MVIAAVITPVTMMAQSRDKSPPPYTAPSPQPGLEAPATTTTTPPQPEQRTTTTPSTRPKPKSTSPKPAPKPWPLGACILGYLFYFISLALLIFGTVTYARKTNVAIASVTINPDPEHWITKAKEAYKPCFDQMDLNYHLALAVSDFRDPFLPFL